jgi:20S proteasome subunit alpha 5
MAVEVLKGVMEDKISSSNVEVATVTKQRGYHVCTQAELAVILARMEE